MNKVPNSSIIKACFDCYATITIKAINWVIFQEKWDTLLTRLLTFRIRTFFVYLKKIVKPRCLFNFWQFLIFFICFSVGNIWFEIYRGKRPQKPIGKLKKYIYLLAIECWLYVCWKRQEKSVKKLRDLLFHRYPSPAHARTTATTSVMNEDKSGTKNKFEI